MSNILDIYSRPYDEQGRQTYERVFGRRHRKGFCQICADAEEAFNNAHMISAEELAQIVKEHECTIYGCITKCQANKDNKCKRGYPCHDWQKPIEK